MPRLILSGRRFGRLVVSDHYKNVGKRIHWWCKCDCGNHKWIDSSKLTSGNTLSCRCLRKEKLARALTKHGCAMLGKHTPEYNAWLRMNQRCTDDKIPSFHNYGGRGITVCERWSGSDGFVNFLADMGHRPSLKHSLDRVNVNGNYEPLNCRWATTTEQARNKRNVAVFNYNGKPMTIPEIAASLGLNRKALWKRIHSKMRDAIVLEAVAEELEIQRKKVTSD